MTNNQAFNFLSKYGDSKDVKIILDYYASNGARGHNVFGVLRLAWRLKRNVPVAKIIGRKWFYGLKFHTDRHTMDPRPDSETLVGAVLGDGDAKAPARILDLGTGTGCLLCAILTNMPNASGMGIDDSRGARRVARKNIEALGLKTRAEIRNCSFKNCGRLISDSDIIVANPPYIPLGDRRVNPGAKHDPKAALYGGRDGRKYYRQIAKAAADQKSPGTKLYLEIGAGQERAVRIIFEGAGWAFAARHKDLSGRVRVLVFA